MEGDASAASSLSLLGGRFGALSGAKGGSVEWERMKLDNEMWSWNRSSWGVAVLLEVSCYYHVRVCLSVDMLIEPGPENGSRSGDGISIGI